MNSVVAVLPPSRPDRETGELRGRPTPQEFSEPVFPFEAVQMMWYGFALGKSGVREFSFEYFRHASVQQKKPLVIRPASQILASRYI